MFLYEILVPTEMINVNTNKLKPIKTRYHRVWDKKVRDITNGLTIAPVVKGHWLNPSKELFVERMIPVRIMATEEQMKEIVSMTIKYYNQEAVFFYVISSQVEVVFR